MHRPEIAVGPFNGPDVKRHENGARRQEASAILAILDPCREDKPKSIKDQLTRNIRR
jgi:hypothetical protein